MNELYTEMIRSLFGIDGFIGQIFVVTHSSNILLDDHRLIVRVYREKGSAAAACGSLLGLTRIRVSMSKHWNNGSALA